MGSPLGDFLRARRDAARPEAFGLPSGSRRRAPGLRRAELATLAGISVEYLVRIEQGRDRNPSVAVVNALAETLRLDVAEREHLRHLTKITAGECVGDPPQPRSDLRPTVRRLLDQLEPGLAYLTNRLGDVLAATEAFTLVTRPSGLWEGEPPNLTRFVFTDPRARQVFPDWDAVADERAFDLWRGPSGHRSEAFRAELAPVAGGEFTRRFERHELPTRTVLHWRHPDAELRFHREELELPAGDAQQLVVLLPADDATEQAVQVLRLAAARPLRAVT